MVDDEDDTNGVAVGGWGGMGVSKGWTESCEKLIAAAAAAAAAVEHVETELSITAGVVVGAVVVVVAAVIPILLLLLLPAAAAAGGVWGEELEDIESSGLVGWYPFNRIWYAAAAAMVGIAW